MDEMPNACIYKPTFINGWHIQVRVTQRLIKITFEVAVYVPPPNHKKGILICTIKNPLLIFTFYALCKSVNYYIHFNRLKS